MPHSYRKIVELIDGGDRLAAALVLSAQGSTPQRAGARAIVEQSGRLWGTVGGGAVEAEAQRMAAEACQSQRPRLLDFEMNSLDAADEGAICGGRMRVLVDPTVARHRSCFAQAADALANRRRGCLLTRIRTGPEVEVEVQWLAETSPARRRDLSRRRCDSILPGKRPSRAVRRRGAAHPRAAEEVFVEPVLPHPLLVIAGGGHVGQAVALEAFRVGFDVTVIDDRPEFAAAALFPPGVSVLCGPIPEQIAACPLDEDSFVVLVTRGPSARCPGAGRLHPSAARLSGHDRQPAQGGPHPQAVPRNRPGDGRGVRSGAGPHRSGDRRGDGARDRREHRGPAHRRAVEMREHRWRN